MRLPRSLQGRLLVLVLGMVITVWSVTAVATWFDARHELDELLDGHLAQAAALLVVQQSHEAAEGEYSLDSPTLHRYAPRVAFQVFHEGRLMLRSTNAPIAAMVDPGEGFTAGFRTVRFEQHAWRVFAAHGGEPDVQVYVAAARHHALRATLAGCDRATRLVEQLLTLSRLESGAAPVSSPVKLGSLVRQVVAELAHQAVQKGQTIELDAGGEDEVQGDATLLAVLVRNLVDNAIRYSPAGASVRIAVASEGAHLFLRVDDRGPGMSDADMRRAGERFFRAIGSGETGSGLGWSIVRSIVAAHRATAVLSRSAGLGGLAAEIAWPKAQVITPQ